MNIAQNIYIARIDRRSIVLDLNRDRYIGLNEDLSDALQYLPSSSHKENHIPIDRACAINKLLKQGIITCEGQTKYRSASAQIFASTPTLSLWARSSDERSSDDYISAARMVSAVVCLTQVTMSLRFRSFKHTIDWLKKRKIMASRRRTDIRPQPLPRTKALLDAFYEVRPYFPIKPICRLDAPALFLYLHQNGEDSELVFGVRLDPFAAHCWVQMGEVAISEAWDRVRQYTPILVI